MNSKLKAYIQLSRPINVLITFISIPIACWITGGDAIDWLKYFFASLTGALVTAGANAINDSFDIEIDRINRPERPLPKGMLTQQDAELMWLTTSVTAIAVNILFNFSALMIVVFAVVLLYYYSSTLKRTVILGNMVVGIMTGMAFIYGGVVAGTIDRAIMPALFAFLSNFSREIIKDIEDIEGDKKGNAVTLPIKYGIKTALIITTILLVLLIYSTIIAVKSEIYKQSFLYIVFLADLLIIVSIMMMWQNQSPKQMRKVSNNLKLVMLIGLLSIIAGSI